MSLFYRIAYGLGFTPWERAATHPPAAAQIARLLNREQSERSTPYGKALDLGCGTGYWSIELAMRGWQVTGIDNVPGAIRQARRRAENAHIEVPFVRVDMTELKQAEVGSGYEFVWDFGAMHGLSPAQLHATGKEVSAITRPGATLLMLAWTPGLRRPLPRGLDRRDIEAAFPLWHCVDEEEFDVSGLPAPLKKVSPRFYRFRRD